MDDLALVSQFDFSIDEHWKIKNASFSILGNKASLILSNNSNIWIVDLDLCEGKILDYSPIEIPALFINMITTNIKSRQSINIEIQYLYIELSELDKNCEQYANKFTRLRRLQEIEASEMSKVANGRREIPQSTIDFMLCECGCPSHQCIIQYYPDDKDVYMYICLQPLVWWKRVAVAFSYLFNLKRKFPAAFEEIILRKSDADKLRRIADVLVKNNDELLEQE